MCQGLEDRSLEVPRNCQELSQVKKGGRGEGGSHKLKIAKLPKTRDACLPTAFSPPRLDLNDEGLHS